MAKKEEGFVNSKGCRTKDNRKKDHTTSFEHNNNRIALKCQQTGRTRDTHKREEVKAENTKRKTGTMQKRVTKSINNLTAP
jgi:hypothetical protein